MASIHKREKRWRVCWRRPGGGTGERSCPTKATARTLQREVEEALALGRDWKPGGVGETAQPRLHEVVERFIREVVRSRAQSTAEVTARNLDVWLRWLDEAALSDEIHLDVLSKSMLDRYYDSLTIGLHDKPRKPVTKKKLIHAVERFWRWAYDEEELTEFILRPRTLNMPTSPGVPTLAPNWEQMDACVSAAIGLIHRLACVLRYTGLRVQQIMGLLWDDLDLDNHLLTIRGELGKTNQEKRGRIIPVSPHLVELVSGWGRREGWLVGSNRTGQDSRLARQRDMRRAWRRSGVREAVWKGHSHRAFRKGFMSGLKRLGADDEAVKYLVGHDLGVRGHYVDPIALPLLETVALIPCIGDTSDNTELDAKREAKTANAPPTKK